MITILVVILLIILLGGFTGAGGPVVLPGNPVPYGFGFGNGGLFGLVLFVVLIAVLLRFAGQLYT